MLCPWFECDFDHEGYFTKRKILCVISGLTIAPESNQDLRLSSLDLENSLLEYLLDTIIIQALKDIISVTLAILSIIILLTFLQKIVICGVIRWLMEFTIGPEKSLLHLILKILVWQKRVGTELAQFLRAIRYVLVFDGHQLHFYTNCWLS